MEAAQTKSEKKEGIYVGIHHLKSQDHSSL